MLHTIEYYPCQRSNLVFIHIAHVHKNVDCLPFYLSTVLSKDITLRYTTLECNGHVVMVKVSMNNDKNREKIHIEEL